MKITKSEFGTTKNGSIINLFHLENTSGAYVEIIDFGCRLTKIVVPDRNGDPVDVCLGFSTADHYADDDASLGAVVGRVANRIKDGHFSLNGKEYQLAINNGTNHLHGGIVGYASKIWESKIKDDKLIFTMNSADGEEGYPGNLTLTVTYGWSEDNELSILYEASTDADTLFNVTNHGYFNLNGEGHGDIMSHELFIDADEITELDDSQAPTGKFIPVDGTPFDFRTMHTIGKMYNSDYEQLKKIRHLRSQLCHQRNRSQGGCRSPVKRDGNPHDLLYGPAGSAALCRKPANEASGKRGRSVRRALQCLPGNTAFP